MLTFAIPFASRMGFFDKFIDKTEVSTSKYRDIVTRIRER